MIKNMNKLPIELVNIIYYKTYNMIYNDVIKDINKIKCFIYGLTIGYPNTEYEEIIENVLDYNGRMNFLRIYKYTGGKVTFYDFIEYDIKKFSALLAIKRKRVSVIRGPRRRDVPMPIFISGTFPSDYSYYDATSSKWVVGHRNSLREYRTRLKNM